MVRLQHELYFAGASQRWSGPVAFLALDRTDEAFAIGRAYLIRHSQVEDVIAQENGRRSIEPIAHLPSPGQHLEIDVEGKYNVLVGLDACDGCAALTLTTNRVLPRGRPTEQYIAVVEAGLQEMEVLYGDEVTSYLAAVMSRARRDGSTSTTR
jgi:hypothetical protein